MLQIYWYFYAALAIILESFPISSSGHLALLDHIIHATATQDFLSVFDHILHGPIALCIALYFYPRWRFFLHPWRARFIIGRLVVLGFVVESITVIFYILFSKFSVSWFPLWIGFLITAFLLFSLCFCTTKRTKKFDLQMALILGLMQGLALLPGISRFGATFAVARWLGLDKQKAFELSFLLVMPLLSAAFVKGIVSYASSSDLEQLLNPMMVLVMIGSSIGFYLGLLMVHKLILKNQLWYMSFYVLGISLLALLIHT